MGLAQQFKFLLKETAVKWLKDNCVRLGASLSYYTLFSLFPLILVVLFITRLLLVNSDIARSAILTAAASSAQFSLAITAAVPAEEGWTANE